MEKKYPRNFKSAKILIILIYDSFLLFIVHFVYQLTFCLYFYRKVYNRFGVVTSFTGTYRADEWSLVINSSGGTYK